MKKQIIAAAVAVAVAAPAMAQVSISGRVGATYDNFKNAPINGRGQNQASIGDNNTRVIFGITEDLGGGLKFAGQIDIRGNTDVGATTTANTSGNTFASVTGGWGRVLVGSHDMLYNEVLGFGTSGDVLDGVNIHRRTLFTSNRDNTGGAAPTQITGTRVNNLLRYDSPTFGGGFNFTLGYSTNPAAAELPSNTEATDRDDDGSASMVFARYASGPLKATLGYYNEKRDAVTGAPAAAKPSDKFTLAAVSYVVGPLEIGLNMTTAAYKSGVDGARTQTRDNFSIPVNYSMGSTTLHAGYTEVGSNNRSRNTGAAQWMVGATHFLSKRTLLGAGYSALSNGNNARYQMLGTVPADTAGGMIGAAGGDATYYGFGIRHNF